MEYKIIYNPNYTDVVKIGLIIQPDNDPLKFFLSGVNLKNFPELIEYVSGSNSWGQEFISIRFFNDMDWEDKAELNKIGGIKEGEVSVYHQIMGGNTVLKEQLFDKILFDYSTKLLEVYKEDRTLPENWVFKMEEGLKKLKEKIYK
ncbi:MAG: hypothetical protein WBP45_10825 [Daejeonella sp.]